MNPAYLVILFFTLLVAAIPPEVYPQEALTYQHDVDGYTGGHEVSIAGGLNDRSFGDLMQAAVDINILIKFDNVSVPAGKYLLKVDLNLDTLNQSGTVNAYVLKKTAWSDPSANIVAATDSVNPTWTHENFDSVPWQQAGAAGSEDRGALLDSRLIDTFPAPVFEAEVQYETEQTALGFILTTSDADVFFLDHESTADPTQNPKLILEPLASRPRGGLNWNAFFHVWKFFF